MLTRRHTIAILLVLPTILVAQAHAQVAATIDGEAIDVADVQRMLGEAYGDVKKIAKEALPRFRAHGLRQLIDQRLVAKYLARTRMGVREEEVDLAIEEFQKGLKRDQLSFADFLKSKGHTEDSFRRQVAWQMGWKRFTARKMTAKAIEEAFAKHRREVDGTELRVSHILIKPGGSDDPAKIRQQIAAGTLTFEAAVKQYSAGTKTNGGDLGFIRRRGSMPEAFSRAAFRLEKGEISEPVASRFGVHLIRWTEIKPGKETLEDDKVRDAVKGMMTTQLFAEIAAAERKRARVVYSGKSPYFKPESGELVMP